MGLNTFFGISRNSPEMKTFLIKIVDIHIIHLSYSHKIIDPEKIASVRIPIKFALLKILCKVLSFECIMVDGRRLVSLHNETPL
jgi:hypothetical protein